MTVTKEDEEFLGEKLDDLKKNSESLPPHVKEDLEKNIDKYKKLILRMAQKYVRSRVEYEDVIQEAFIGLVLATRDFDPTRSKDFHTYAVYRMKGKMYDYCIGNESPIYVPTHIAKAVSYVKQMQTLLQKELASFDEPGLVADIILNKSHKSEKLLTPLGKLALKDIKRKLSNIARNSESSYERLTKMAHSSISSMVSDEILGKIPKEPEDLELKLDNIEVANQLKGFLGEKRFNVLMLRYQGFSLREIAEQLKELGYTNRKGECVSRQAVKAALNETLELIIDSFGCLKTNK